MIGPLQTTASAGPVALLLFLGLLLSGVLSAVVLARGVESYRRTGDPALLGLAVGILLLSGGATLVNLGLANATPLPTWAVTTAADLTRLAGLAVMLAVIYGVPESGTAAAAALGAGQWVSAATGAVTGLAGAFVAYQAYRGYRRNASAPMLSLAAGTALLTVVPFAASQALVLAGAAPVAVAATAQTSRLVGLLAVLVAFAR
ncbi:MAG: hypothetical protein ABEJ89_08540 [Haloarculaceae archaeon]